MAFSKNKWRASLFGAEEKEAEKPVGKPMSETDKRFFGMEQPEKPGEEKAPEKPSVQPEEGRAQVKQPEPEENVPKVEEKQPSPQEEPVKPAPEQETPRRPRGSVSVRSARRAARSKAAASKPVRQTKWMEFNLDTTYSFSTIYPRVYDYLTHLISRLEEEPSCDFRYGLTVFQGGEIRSVDFQDGAFTKSAEEFKKELERLDFSGGSQDGCEEIMLDALAQSLEKLEGAEEQDDKCLLMFTDSIPSEDEEDLESDFEDFGPVSCAYIYSYEGKFSPYISVQKKGRRIQNNLNVLETRDINTLSGTEDTASALKAEAEALAARIIRQME